jgi:hypothetical protein
VTTTGGTTPENSAEPGGIAAGQVVIGTSAPGLKSVLTLCRV